MSADTKLLNRRHFLSSSVGGLGNIALAWLLARDRALSAPSVVPSVHHRPVPRESCKCSAAAV